MNNNTTRRLLAAMLLGLLFCLALGGAWAEECQHEEMDFMPNPESDTLTESCSACGYHAQLQMPLLVVTEGSDYTYEPVTSGKDEWDVPYNLIYVAEKAPSFAPLTVIDKPTAVGTYYVVPELPWDRYPRVFGKIVIISKDHVHRVHCQASGNAIIAACSGCGMSSKLTLNMSNASAGEAKPATLTTTGTWLAEFPVITYYDAKGNPLSALPQEAGDYYAAISVDGAVATQAFTLTETVVDPVLLPADRIITNAPHGLAFAKKTITDGQYHMVISKKDTDWANVIAQLFDTQRQMTIWQTPHIKPYPGATGYKAKTAETDAEIESAVNELRALNQSNNLHGNATLSMTHLGGYTPENGLFVPYGNDGHMTDVIGWYKNGKLIAIELLKSSVTFDDDTSFAITPNKLGAANILPATNLSQEAVSAMEIVKNDASVTYRADNTDQFNTSVIETSVLLPQAAAGLAATCEIRYDVFKEPTTVPVETINGKPGVRIPSALPASGSAKGYSYTLTFKDAQGNFVKAYGLTVTIRVGKSVPFPLYHDDWSAIPASRMQLQVTSESGASIPAGLGLSYDSTLGIVNYDIDSRKLPRDRSLDGVLGTVHILPPEGAKAYRMYPPFESGISVRPDMYSMNNDDSLHAEERIGQSPMTAMSGFFGRNIEFPFLQGHGVSLIDGHPYTLYDLGLPNMGELGAGFRLIYWYEDINAEVPMLKEYVLVTHDPASAPDFTTPALSEDDLGKQDAAFPRVIISRESEDGEHHLFYSDIVPQTSDDELHYELRLTDAAGNPVSTETLKALAPLTVYIPVPDGLDPYDPSLVFTVSHLNAGSTKVTETFSMQNKTLSMTEYGLCFVVDALSPFVLSWDTAAADPAVLPQTGDSAPALPVLFALALMSTAALAFLTRKRHA